MAADRRTVIENCAIATVDAQDTEHTTGHLVLAGDRIESLGPGPAPEGLENVARRIDATGHLATPGLVNTHHHFYQWLTRGLATDHNLFDWLVALYPTWARIDEAMVHAAAQGSLAMMARGGVTTAMDHHYVFPRGSGDLSEAIIGAARDMGVRFTLARGSMDRGESDGGLPPDFAVETLDDALAATEETVRRHHDTSPGAMTQVAVAPCSPFSVSTELMRQGAELARRLGVRLHTHGSETVEEEKFCHELFGMGPTDYFESTGWLGDDVWMAHCVHMNDSDIAAFARTGTGVAHCPSSNARLAAGIARVPDMLAAGVPVGLGVDGTASNESGELHTELRNALLINRLGAHREKALTARQALRLGTHGGARVLGRADEIGSLEPGKLADLVLWRMDTLAHASIADPVTALVFGAAAPVTASFVNGRQIVENGRLLTADEDAVARTTRAEARRLARIAGHA
ncbi:8-oxoguanine deaminase [Streptomyces cellulosae]|jgi:cytosine/adenosine deaminase-related metal-dependent hydrolase|uniref:8-oxoguanine deaminase n=2 Tax=Streptomyces TaxID=1883 RepID=A0ABU3J9C5_9ACTN|nr:8-oxoguanine deaminase [Streptomyces sp. McG7]MDQ0485282.1 cytosine/adenosine deaminase-related metal-dependent hydrolase [Streptomyces thermodiastaticus]MDT6971658.1 8-oxoguanine deaminase [Streptomyces thermocarboxydus]MDX3415858.1 8-oxoguanine deaminase [Streptomyces sp. MD20-1-1]MYW52838.1 8-oxoguanine deaminase [Streptomyces sp. SID8376]THC52911.1 8-oxoguanine deaminase [Streptomyces sp. Akac8]WSB44339.1 8-oxoguanine deaminase [Streptomyces cellulosae]